VQERPVGRIVKARSSVAMHGFFLSEGEVKDVVPSGNGKYRVRAIRAWFASGVRLELCCAPVRAECNPQR